MLERLTNGNGEAFRITMPVGRSGSPGVEYAWLERIEELFTLFCNKQHDYGSNNIAKHGEIGVLVRTDDKLQRLKNLLTSDGEATNESLRDSWMDVMGYGMIGLLCHDGKWPDFKETDVWEATRKVIDREHDHINPNPED